MPLSGEKYVAPVWKDNAPPALDAAELQAMTDAIERTEASIGDVTTPAQKMGLTGNLSVGAALGVLADVGNVHVWRRTVNGTVDFLTSTNPDAYQEASDAAPETYIVGKEVGGSFAFGNPYSSGSLYTMKASSGVTVNDAGEVSLSSPITTAYIYKGGLNDSGSIGSLMLGKFVLPQAASPSSTISSPLPGGNILYIPDDATILLDTSSLTWRLSKYCPVTGVAAVPANSTIEYLGFFGDKSRIEVGSYVGTGVYGETDPNSLTFAFPPKFVCISGRSTNLGILDFICFPYAVPIAHSGGYSTSDKAFRFDVVKWESKTVTWYTTTNYPGHQANGLNEIYYYFAIG